MLAERTEKEIVSGGSSEKNLIGDSASFVSKLCRNFTLMQKVRFSVLLVLCFFFLHEGMHFRS